MHHKTSSRRAFMNDFHFTEHMTETYNNYNNYNYHNMADMTTIQISKATKKRIATFGTKEDSYDTIVNKLYDFASKVQFKQFIMSAENDLTLDEARKMIDEMEE